MLECLNAIKNVRKVALLGESSLIIVSQKSNGRAFAKYVTSVALFVLITNRIAKRMKEGERTFVSHNMLNTTCSDEIPTGQYISLSKSTEVNRTC